MAKLHDDPVSLLSSGGRGLPRRDWRTMTLIPSGIEGEPRAILFVVAWSLLAGLVALGLRRAGLL